MTDTELLQAFRGIVKEEVDPISKRIDNLEKDLNTTKREIATILEEQTDRLQILIETEVTQKINALFDGYSLDHEKHIDLENRTTRLEQRVDDLEVKVS